VFATGCSDGPSPQEDFHFSGRQLCDTAAGGPLTRSVEALFLYESPPQPELAEHTIWSDEFGSVEDFVAAVEALPQ
jgi:hypothetical protein